ncbi:synergin gamma isoform X4 [Pimephales promelas]|uniref:synergin gamma isoform X4 n=1 Tax=Pimephales promelas TaxID=90988 RepID=UPI00195566AB|nr:synergin gamma isoform X4 [Pimephales promelas]KAG1951400.1 synergin gamma [Pimephales promelas]
MALRPGTGGGGSFMYPVGGGIGPPQGMMPMQQQQQQGFPMVQVMQPNMQGMMGMNFGAQMPGAMPMQGGMAMGMQTPGMQFMGQPQFMGMRGQGPQFPVDIQKQMAEEHQKRLEQQQRMLEEDRKRRQFEEQKQKLRLLSSVKPKTGEKSRDDALEAIKGNLDGFSRDAKMHPTPSSQSKKPDSSPSHTSVTSHSLPPAFPDDDDEFSDFVQGPVDASSSFPTSSLPPSSPSLRAAQVSQPLELGPGQHPPSSPLPHTVPSSLSVSPVIQHSSVISSSQTAFQGVGVYPQQDLQPMVPAWLYNDSLIPELFKKVLDFTMTPAGIDTAKLYPILISSGLPREALGQIWALANRTTPGKLTKEELYTVLALIGVAQSGLTVMSLDILGQFPSPPVPNLPAMAMAINAVLPQHQQPIMTQPPVSMAMPVTAPPVMGMTPNPAAQPPATFITNFPPVQATKPDDDDFQDFQEAPKAGDDSFTDFQGETGGVFPSMKSSSQSCVPAMLTPVSGSSSSSSSDKYAVFKQLSVEQPAEPTAPVSDSGDKYSVFRELEKPSDRKPAGEGFADFKSVSADDGFTDFKTADAVSPLDPPDQAKFQPTFPPPFTSSQSLSHSQPSSLAQPRNLLNMADLDLFTTMAPPAPTSTADSKLNLFPSAPPSLVLPKPPSVVGDDFGDFALFGSSSSSEVAPATSVAGRGAGTVVQDDFADFMAFGSSRDQKSEPDSGDCGGESQAEPSQQRQQIGGDKYDVFKQLSLEGGLAYDDNKESGGGSFSSLKSDNDDFADFQSSKFCTALGASDKSLVDKVAAFKQAKEDSASVKSLDLPSIGGSSVGKEDSEDTLSVQLDMKLSDMGGDLKHVMSDSSLDLPGLSSHQPPAAESDDLKFDPFGTSAVSSLGSYDWSDKDDLPSGQGKKLQGESQGGLPSSAVVHRKETSFGSSENITHTTVAKVTTFPIEDGGSTAENRFEAFADFGSIEQAGQDDDDDDFGDFASTVSEKSDSPPGIAEAESNQGEMTDEFGAFQGDKPKFGKSDFLKASTQAKVKSSEEMIKNELATFDLSVQGSHKRSHSLGEKEIVRSIPSPAPEQPFRDRSNTLNEKPALPIIRDKYKDLTGEVEESERYAYEWQRCLESALQVINTANNTLNSISSSTVCTEVIQSAQGTEYLLGVVEVYRVTKRVELGIKATAVCSEKLQELLKDISRVWNNLMGFMSLANLTPDESSLDFSSCILRHGIKNAKELACGVCLLNVDSRSKKKNENTFGRLFKRALTKDSRSKLRAFNSETDNFKLMYGGHQYHASCANFWINCVEPKPPGLILPDLL